MNWKNIQGVWKQLKGTVREEWGELTDDKFSVVNGKRERFVGDIQVKRGVDREEAEKQTDAWVKRR